MSTITTRANKGSPLTNAEIDANVTNLNTDKLEKSGGTMTGALTLEGDPQTSLQAATMQYVDAHMGDTVDAHAAGAISNVAAGGIVATTVQAAINELDSEKAPIASPTFTGTATLGGALKTHPLVAKTFTPAGTTTWYRLGSTATTIGNKVTLVVALNRGGGGGHQIFEVVVSKATAGVGAGVLATVRNLGGYDAGAYCVAEVRIVDAGVNAATHVDVRFRTAESYDVYATALSQSPVGAAFTLDADMTSQGTGAAGIAVDPRVSEWLWNSADGVIFSRSGSGFTALGTGAPSIKMKKLTGTTHASEGGVTSIAHGLTGAKIIGMQVLVAHAANSGVLLGFVTTAGYQYDAAHDSANVTVNNHATNSENILSKAITILITYEE